MREIKAYVRPERLEAVVRALHDGGIGHLVVTHVHSLGKQVDPATVRISMEAGTRYTEHAKIEFVCTAPEVDHFVILIREQARTGERGDGMIFVSPVERAVKIRTGVAGREALH